MQGGLLQIVKSEIELLTLTTGTEDTATVGTVLGPRLEIAVTSSSALAILDGTCSR
jgi:hypothetical protein